METIILNPTNLGPAIAALKAGQLVAFPTETVYGLGANGSDADAVGKIYQAKGRPSDNPLILHVRDQAGLQDLAEGPLPDSALKLVQAFWPGPLTVVVRSRASVPDRVRAGLDTVAVRAPDHPVAQALLRGLPFPVAAPSANRSGRPSPTTAEAVWDDLNGRVSYIVDGGPTRVGVESTVVDCTTDPITLLRPGGLSIEMLTSVVGVIQQASGEGPVRSPGMKYRHYAPEAPVIWIESTDGRAARPRIEALARSYGKLGIIAPDGSEIPDFAVGAGLGPDETSAAERLFSAIRALDAGNPGAIVILWESDRGLGLAIRNRIEKASTMRVGL